MPGPDIDFARFRDAADAEALARVFDACAGQLLLIAMRLAPDVPTAEDLVQSAFVKAIEGARTFRSGTALMPWLIGIVVNEARMLRRRERRKNVVPLEARLELPDPCDEAAGRELERTLLAAIEGLEPQYREVLLLRLRHGLSSVEIAQALGRSADTVRSQWKRGLERLRRLLPAGALPAALVADGGRGLPAVRDAVLAHARPGLAAAAPHGLWLGGLLLVNKLALVAGSLLALGVVVWVVAPWARGNAQPAPESCAGAGTTTQPATAPSAVDAALPSLGVRALERVPLEGQPEAPAASNMVRGRCVDERGSPLAGCVVRIASDPNAERRSGPPSAGVAQEQPRPARVEPSVVTGGDGAFAVAVATPAQVTLRLTCADRTTRTVRPGAERKDVGDVVLWPACIVRGRVVDQDGKPVTVAAASVQFTRGAPPGCGAPEDLELRRQYAVLDAAGGFATREALAVGAWHVAVSAKGIVGEDASLVDVRPGLEPLLLRVRTSPPIRGVVVDESGAPIANLTVGGEALQPVSGFKTTFALSAADGTFALVAGHERPGESVRLVVHTSPRADAYEMVGEPRVVRFGTEGVRVVVRRLPSLAVLARAETGEPLPSYWAVLTPDGKEPELSYIQFPTEGHGVIRGVRPEPALVRIVPDDMRLRVSDPLRLVPDGAEGVFTLRKARSIPVRIVSAGKPLANARLELIDPRGKEVTATEPKRSLGGAGIGVHFVCDATTDARGNAAVHVRWDAPHYVLRVSTAGHATRVMPFEVPRDDKAVEVELDAGGALRLAIASLAATRCGGELRILLRRATAGGIETWPSDPNSWEPIHAREKVELSGVPAGTWSVHLAPSGRVPMLPALGEVVVEQGKTVERSLDARAFTCAQLACEVRLRGQRVEAGRLSLRRVDTGVGASEVSFVGALSGTEVLPGEYDVELFPMDQVAVALGKLRITLRAGERHTAALGF